MQNAIKEKLCSVRASAEKVYTTSQDINAICQEAMQELSCYEHIIPDFFSYNNEAIRIKALYKQLKELDYTRNKVISVIKVGCAAYLYEEYLTGMVTFINNFFDEIQNKGNNLPTLEKQLQTAIQGDPLFIESLFGGKNNEVVEEELTSAIQNVEYLVDFFDYIKGVKSTVIKICESAKQYPEYENSASIVRLIANSTGVFCNKVIDSIICTYCLINEALDNKPSKPVNNTFRVF